MEPKALENLDMLIRDLKECRNSIEMLLIKINSENVETIDWPAILNSLRIVSTNLISISKFIRDKKDMLLKSVILMPKFFSEDIDPEIKEMTNGRISVFNQDVIPHILRTKLIPVLEENEKLYYQAAKEFEQTKGFDKNISQLKKTLDESANLIEKPKRESELSKTTHNTYNYQDTWQLVNMYVNLSTLSRASRSNIYPRTPMQS
jgi:hypothetical protein